MGRRAWGLIMLILVGTVPTAYALNHTVSATEMQTFAAVSTQVAGALDSYKRTSLPLNQAEPELTEFVAKKAYEPERDSGAAAGDH